MTRASFRRRSEALDEIPFHSAARRFIQEHAGPKK